jgi:alkylation response protein AidB-like acyl-CoA dehydrogenase
LRRTLKYASLLGHCAPCLRSFLQRRPEFILFKSKLKLREEQSVDIIQYTDEHRIFRQTLRKFLEKEITPHAEEWEEACIVPREAWKKMGDQ